MSVFFTGANPGDIADATTYQANWNLLEASLFDLGPYVISGLSLSIGTGLSVNVTAGVASIGGEVNAAGSFSIGSLTPSTTNHLYLLQNGTGTANTTGTAPANSVKLGTCVTGVGTVTSVAMTWASGRQLKVRGENIVMGGGAGNPRSLNLASWAASGNEGQECVGVLPAGAIPTSARSSATAFGSEPGSPSTGDLDFYTNVPAVARWNGSAWVRWGKLQEWTNTPAAASLTALNVTTATIADFGGGLWVSAPNISASHLQGWYQALGAGAYSWVIRIDPTLLSTTFTAGGMFLRDSAGGKIISFEQNVFGAGNLELAVVQWSDANTRVSNAYSAGLSQIFPWMRIADDGTTSRTYYVSQDGQNWLVVYTEARTTYLGVAPNQAGIFACANGGAVGVNVYSWTGI